MSGLVIAIDGPAAAGKGTLARRLAAALGVRHLDTGLLYRAVGRRVLDAGGDPGDPAVALGEAVQLQASDLRRDDLRGPVADAAASAVARHQAVREALLAFQRQFPGESGAVIDGRDIGTVVFPGAPVKLFVVAKPEVRARRRWEELGRGVPFATIAADMQARDQRDSSRAAAPLTMADDAILIDTSEIDADQAFAAALAAVRERVPSADEPPPG